MMRKTISLGIEAVNDVAPVEHELYVEGAASILTKPEYADGEALRNDDRFLYVAAWEFTGDEPRLHKEPLAYEEAKLATRSYK